MDRRALFMSGAAATLLSAAGVCAQGAPQRGGVLRLALQRRDTECPVLAGAVYETLTDIGPDGVVRPMLATHWDSRDGQHWTLTLRSDVKFHDGSVFDAYFVRDILLQVSADITVLGDQKVAISLPVPDPNLPWRLADPALSMRRPGGVGTGLYRLVDQRAQRHFIAARVDKHHRDGVAGWADRVEAITISDAKVRAQALQEGHVDVAELPWRDGLQGRFHYHPSADQAVLAAQVGVMIPVQVAVHAPLDGGRIAERWSLS
jgi:ABC-type transport system substrate-binding protein